MIVMVINYLEISTFDPFKTQNRPFHTYCINQFGENPSE